MSDFVGLILAGGFGSRMLPATKTINKALLPVYSSEGAIPMVCYPLNTLIKLGIKNVLIISSQEHCGRIIEFFGDGEKLGVDLTYKIQDMNNKSKPPGIASALKLARGFTQDKKFSVILGDNFFEDSFAEEAKTFVNSNSKFFTFLKPVEDPERFGCACVDGQYIKKIVEKPKNPETNMAVTGLYFYTPEVYEIADMLKVSGRGELEVTDINQYYVSRDRIQYKLIDGYWSDMGTPQSIMRTQDFISMKSYKILSENYRF